MFGEFAKCLQNAGLGVMIEELEDIFWLAERLPAVEASPSPSGGDEEERARRREGEEKLKKGTASRREESKDRENELGELGTSLKADGATTELYSTKLSGTIRASTLRVPGAAAIEHPKDLGRALQPFARRVPSGWRSALDEDETASRAAEAGVWCPVYSPLRERWFDLSLVIDSSPSMDLWVETLNGFQRLLRNQGGFRSVNTYFLNDSQGKQIATADGRTTYSISHLLERNRQHLILLVTDATSERWRNRAAQTFLCELGSSTAVSILQLLPRHAWRHTCVGEPELTLFTERAGEANSRMRFLLPWWLDESDAKAFFGVPVIGLDAATIGQWARSMTARGGAAIPGVLIAKPGAHEPVVVDDAKATEVVAESPAARVARFRSMVSRSAYDLAVFLSVPHPLTIPVMRLVQRTMLPSSSTAELAEFFVGRLLQRMEDTPPAEDGQPPEASYRFSDGVREELTKLLRYSEEGEINTQLRLVGKYLQEGGSESSSFEAYFPSPEGRHTLTEWTLPFASLSRQVLRGRVVQPESEGNVNAKAAQAADEFREPSKEAVAVQSAKANARDSASDRTEEATLSGSIQGGDLERILAEGGQGQKGVRGLSQNASHNRVDLIVLAAPRGPQNASVIFVHGLGGDPLKTWTSPPPASEVWPKWLAEDIEGLAVFSVSYDAPASNANGEAMHLTDLAISVLNHLLVEPRLEQGEVILIGHSLGGLVIKQILRKAESEKYRRAEAASFIERVRKVAFLATPHAGADLAGWRDRLRILFRPSVATNSLDRDDPYLRELNQWYRDWARDHRIDHLILTERKDVHAQGMIVKPDQGDPGLSSNPIPIDADHITITKPANRNSEIYVYIRDFIGRLGLMKEPEKFRFAIALSFPGEHRAFVKEVAEHLAANFGKERVLYDKWLEAEFARVDLDVYLPNLYRTQSELIVIFLCQEYKATRWGNLEWRFIEQLIATVDASRIMLLRYGFDGDLTEIGIFDGDGIINFEGRPAKDIAEKIIERFNFNHEITPKKPLPGPVTADISRIDRYAPEKLIGREAEIKLLDDAWAMTLNDDTGRPHVLTFVALGGEGKTSLVAKWAAKLAHQGWPGCEAAFAWSFYSQGTREQVAASSDLFLKEALAFFGDPTMAGGPQDAYEKGKRLAQLVGEKRALLILDGLEPLQYAPTSPTPGELKDAGLKALLKGLAQNNRSFCIVTTRYSIPDLRANWHGAASEVTLLRLSKEAGVELLKSLGVKGAPEEFEALVEEVKGHALALTLIGSFLRDAYGGDIRKRDLVRLEMADAEISMDSYVKWFESEGEKGLRALAMLRLLGLFDRPADAGCLVALWKAPAIPGLTEPLIAMDEAQRNIVLKRLEDANLLMVNREKSGALVSLDIHPLRREYFVKELRERHSEAWRAAHRRLFEYLCTTTKDKPQPTLKDLEPLYRAVAHGCKAGMQVKALQDVFRARIQRGSEFYSTTKLGAFGSDLATVACFFDEPWSRVSAALTESDQSWLLTVAGIDLRALGRLTEALDPMRAGLEIERQGGGMEKRSHLGRQFERATANARRCVRGGGGR